MKIIQISTFFHPVTGGVEIQALEIAKNLMESGHSVKVFTTDSTRNRGRLKEKESIVNGVKVKRFKTLFSISQFYKIAPGMYFQLMKEDFDVLHVHGFRKFEVYMALLAAKRKNKKVVVTTHNPFTANTRSGKLSLLVKLHDMTLGRWFTKKIDRIICLLGSEVEIIHKKFRVPKNQIVVIPNGIGSEFFTDTKVDKSKFLKSIGVDSESSTDTTPAKEWKGIVLAACRLNKVKGIQNLKIAADELPEILFLIIGGDDGYKNELEHLYRRNANVVITGKYLTHDKIKEAYTAADVFVLPSLHEPFGLTPVEAVASGTPVIATNIGGTKEVLSSNYTVFLDPNDGEAWKSAIEKLISDDEERKNMIAIGRKDVEKYRWDNVIPQLIKVYENITK